MNLMQEKNITGKNVPAPHNRVLLCDPGESADFSMPGMEMVSSPIRCLDRAVEESPGLIGVVFGNIPIREREYLLELCAALTRNPYTKDIPVIALLRSKHRGLLEFTEKAGVKHVRYIRQNFSDPEVICNMMEELGQEDTIGFHLSMLCPYLRYSPLDSQTEISICAAYLDRMVLGGSRLHKICETHAHSGCEYFLKPRIAL